jgi:hypothetical protein
MTNPRGGLPCPSVDALIQFNVLVPPEVKRTAPRGWGNKKPTGLGAVGVSNSTKCSAFI